MGKITVTVEYGTPRHGFQSTQYRVGSQGELMTVLLKNRNRKRIISILMGTVKSGGYSLWLRPIMDPDTLLTADDLDRIAGEAWEQYLWWDNRGNRGVVIHVNP